MVSQYETRESVGVAGCNAQLEYQIDPYLSVDSRCKINEAIWLVTLTNCRI